MEDLLNELGGIWKEANNQFESFILKFLCKYWGKTWNFSVLISDLELYLEIPDYDGEVLAIHPRRLIKQYSQSVNEDFLCAHTPR